MDFSTSRFFGLPAVARSRARPLGGGRHADAPRGRVTGLAPLHPRQVVEAVVGGQEHHRDGRPLLHTHPPRHPRHQLGLGRDVTTEAAVRQADHRLAHPQRLHPFAHGDDPAGTFSAEQPRIPWVHAEGVQDIPEVQPRGFDLDLHLALAGHPPVHRHQLEVVEHAPRRDLQLEGLAVLRRWHRRPTPLGPAQPRDEPLPAPVRHLVLAVPRADLGGERRRVRRAARVQVHPPTGELGMFQGHGPAQPPERRLPRRDRRGLADRLRPARHEVQAGGGLAPRQGLHQPQGAATDGARRLEQGGGVGLRRLHRAERHHAAGRVPGSFFQQGVEIRALAVDTFCDDRSLCSQ
jgi:hypothetical protein